ncbi:MAG: DUF2520 domain-containing protein [Paludibacteraceae bacterium]|nr:DUF2520 domain-containing protein [Paludibacteraceae bacterium]
MKIVIIGAGNVGMNLHHAFGLKHINVELVHARELVNGQINDQMVNDKMVNGFDVYIYAVVDKVLRQVAGQIDAPKALHLHTSGTMPIEVFGKDKPHAGVLYFFQSFSKEQLIDDWSDIPCFIEGRDIDDIAAIYSLAQTLTSRIYEANQHDRERLHIAGVFANNYTNLMYRMAAQVLQDTQIPFAALLPLIDYTAAKVHAMTPREAQTGPALRGDAAVILHHLEILDKAQNGEFFSSDLEFAYMSLAQILQTVARPEETRHSIAEILGQALEESDETEQNYPIPSRRHRRRH